MQLPSPAAIHCWRLDRRCRSPDGAKRHPGPPVPHFASLNAGYGTASSMTVIIQGSVAESMIRAAILGLGRWGRSLVNSVQGKSRDIQFVAAHTRTRATAEAFCRDKGLQFVESYQDILADPGID